MGLPEIFSLNTWVITGGTIRLLENFLSTSAFNSSNSLIFGEVDCHIFPIPGLQMPPAGGAALVPLIPLVYGVEFLLIALILVLILSLGCGVGTSLIPLWTGVVLLMPVLLVCCVVLLGSVLFDSASVAILCTAGDLSVYGASTSTPAIGFVGGGKTETSSCCILIVRLLNNFWWVILLLAWVILSGSLVDLTCVSLSVALFNSCPMPFIVMFVTELTISSEISILLLTNIVFKFLSVNLTQYCNFQKWLFWRLLLLTLHIISWLSILFLESSRWIMEYYCGHWNWLWYYKIPYNTFLSNFLCTLVDT